MYCTVQGSVVQIETTMSTWTGVCHFRWQLENNSFDSHRSLSFFMIQLCPVKNHISLSRTPENLLWGVRERSTRLISMLQTIVITWALTACLWISAALLSPCRNEAVTWRHNLSQPGSNGVPQPENKKQNETRFGLTLPKKLEQGDYLPRCCG